MLVDFGRSMVNEAGPAALVAIGRFIMFTIEA